MTAIELLNFTLSRLFEGADSEGRKKIKAALEGRLGPGGGIIVDDPTLPESMQGIEAPSWWSDDHDPWADSFTVDTE